MIRTKCELCKEAVCEEDACPANWPWHPSCLVVKLRQVFGSKKEDNKKQIRGKN